MSDGGTSRGKCPIAVPSVERYRPSLGHGLAWQSTTLFRWAARAVDNQFVNYRCLMTAAVCQRAAGFNYCPLLEAPRPGQPDPALPTSSPARGAPALSRYLPWSSDVASLSTLINVAASRTLCVKYTCTSPWLRFTVTPRWDSTIDDWSVPITSFIDNYCSLTFSYTLWRAQLSIVAQWSLYTCY